MKNKWELILPKELGDVVIEVYSNEKLAEEERDNRNRLCIAMGYTPDVKYIIRQVN
jgi:hypothetical protein|tara:strand:+ start:389 stop:556 length:168 start_codon:yes stop_codon:yes gene_type:complete